MKHNNTVLFSPHEGFWSDTGGWSLSPDGATSYQNIAPGTHQAFIGVDDAFHVNPLHYAHWDEADLTEALWAMLADNDGETLASTFKTLNNDEVTYQGDSLWWVNERQDCDTDDLKEMLCEYMLLSDHVWRHHFNRISETLVFCDGDGGFYHCAENQEHHHLLNAIGERLNRFPTLTCWQNNPHRLREADEAYRLLPHREDFPHEVSAASLSHAQHKAQLTQLYFRVHQHLASPHLGE